MLRIRRILGTLAGVTLVLSLALSPLCMDPNPSYAAGDGDQAATDAKGDAEEDDSTEPTRIKLKAYKVTAPSNTWDTGKETKTIGDLGGRVRIAVTANRKAESPISETDQDAWKSWGKFKKGFSYDMDADARKCLEYGDNQGLLNAKADGEGTITVTPKAEEYSKLSASITIKVVNQATGLQVTKLEIVDSQGKAYGDNNLKVTKASEITKLYARVTYADRAHGGDEVVYSNYPGAPAAQKPSNGAFDTLEWNVSSDEYASISKHTDKGSPGVGYFTASANAALQVFATITGADATKSFGKGYGVMVDKVGINIEIPGKAGRVNGEDPADKLTVRVVYEKDLKTEYAREVYTVAELEKLGAVTRYYTLTRSGGRYVTDKAYGVPMATLLKALDVATGDVNYFTLAANDGANPGKITAKWLLKTTRYYLPNYDLGGSWQEKQQTPTMIALKDSWNNDTTLTGDLNSGTRFRLVFGASTSSDNATDKSIKFINTLTVVMKGAPPSRHGDKKTDEGSTQTDPGRGNGGAGGQSGADGSGDGGSGNGRGQAASGQGGSTIGPAGGGSSDAGVAAAGKSVTELDQSTAWRIYQMMNNSNSDLTPIGYEDNPFTPYVLPCALVLLVAAGLWRALRFKVLLRG